MVAYFRHLTVNFNLHTGVKQPDMTSKDRFYKVYSPLKFKLRPRHLLRFKIRYSNTRNIGTVVKFIAFIKKNWSAYRKQRLGRK